MTGAEHALFARFFAADGPPAGGGGGGGGGEDAAAAVALVTEPLSTLLYDLLRPEVVALNDIDALCEARALTPRNRTKPVQNRETRPPFPFCSIFPLFRWWISSRGR